MTTKKDIDILRVSYVHGPNVWNYHPVIEAILDIGELENFPSNTIPGLYERLTALLPTLAGHACTVGGPGGFFARLREGTYAGHILEHVVLELQNLIGMQTAFGRTRQVSDPGTIYKMMFRTDQEQVGRAALAAGRDLLMAAIDGRPYDVAATVARLGELAERLCLGPSTAHIVETAAWRGIPAIRLNEGNLVQLGHGARQRRIWTAETELTGALAESISGDKDLTNRLLFWCGVPVPDGELVRSAEAAWEEAVEIGLPVVLKPHNGNHGRGVSINLNSRDEVSAAYHLASREADGAGVIVESFVRGNEHRLLVVDGRLVAAARGEPAFVSGDGAADILELIERQINGDPRRAAHAALNRIALGESDEIILELERQGLTVRSVPAAGRKVLIQRNGNVDCDVTDEVHPSIAASAILAARVVGLDVAGIDLVAQDISRPLDQQDGAIVEVNASPGLLTHTKPGSGAPRAVGKAIVRHLFGVQALDPGRIPIVGIAGTRGTALIARVIASLLHMSGKYVGLSGQDGQWLNGRKLPQGILGEWDAAQRLLINRNVEAAVFESTPRTMLADGLAYDKCLVGVVTDVPLPAGLEAFYIHERDQLARVLRTQVDVILPHGVAVLNAADELVAGMAGLCDGDVILYGLDGRLPAIAAQRALGRRAAFMRDGHVVLALGADETALLPLSLLKPAVLAQSEAVLAALAAAWALGLDPHMIRAGMRNAE
ncbi:cyanophycin synthetase [Massilia pseudoviolaceinigra]|uniref:cyanophycin synthetase n=1 Tax=Massilia pseudoviolaceinigra TaxID=3057165 RepID=UPI0027965FA1|nr:cyanophycin synthetase [Massilia sp. CCM 9206]MDQ1920910.1 cyanophycin synthetase [Massilia sp. CCM 9206]